MSCLSYDVPDGRPGEVVVATVSNPIQNRASKGKRRPVVIVCRDGARFGVMGLTTLASYANGRPRTAVPNPTAVGLDGPGYLWGQRITWVCVLDVHTHIGWVDEALATLIARQAALGQADARALLAAAEWAWGDMTCPVPPFQRTRRFAAVRSDKGRSW